MVGDRTLKKENKFKKKNLKRYQFNTDHNHVLIKEVVGKIRTCNFEAEWSVRRYRYLRGCE